jgi:hypothetical protein
MKSLPYLRLHSPADLKVEQEMITEVLTTLIPDQLREFEIE